MHVIQQRSADVFNNEYARPSSDDSSWCRTPFDFFVNEVLKVDSDTINPPENLKPEDNLKESDSVNLNERLINTALDHSYDDPNKITWFPKLSPYALGAFPTHDAFPMHGFRGSRSNFEGNQTDLLHHDDEKTLDAHAKVKEDHWNPVREVKDQFIIRSNPVTSHLISSFDVACIVEFNPDGSPVDKMHVLSSCAVHGEYVQGCTMCKSQLASKPMFGNARNGVHLRCIDNKVNRILHVKSHKKKADETLDVTENGENDDKELINKLIADISNKKRNKQPLICEICGKQFTAVATLKNHYRSHGNIKLYACSLCDSTFTRRYGLRYHMQIHNNKYRYTCSECSRKFRHTTHFKAHCRDHSSGKPLQCTLCSSSFKNRNTLNRHVKTKHLSIEE